MNEVRRGTHDFPLWLRPALWSRRLRLAVILGLGACYLGLSALLDPGSVAALRPLNLLVVVAGGLLFGALGGWWTGLSAATGNVTLYLLDGIFAPSTEVLVGNLLSILLGVGVGVVVGHVRDLSLQLREEVERRLLAEEQKEELTALIVHDLKNPLAGILGHSQMMGMADFTLDETKESARSIAGAAEQMTRMVMNLLDIGRAEQGELRLDWTELVLTDLASEVGALVARQLEARSQRLLIRAELAPGPIQGDADLMRRLLLNLVDNAIKYTPAKGTIEIAFGGDERELELSVSDEGPGIPAGYELRIFDKYARLERDGRTSSTESRGLGLAFCRLAAQSHGGRIWVEQATPRGSVFRVRLPRRQVTHPLVGRA